MTSRIPQALRPQLNHRAIFFAMAIAVVLGIWLFGGNDPGTTRSPDESSSQPTAVASAATVRIVSNSAQLQAALNLANPGDTIALGTGTYTSALLCQPSGTPLPPKVPCFTITRSGTALAPIVIKPQNLAKPVLKSGNLILAGSYVRVEQLVFDNTGVVITGKYNRVRRNVFRNGTRAPLINDAAVALTKSASLNRIDYNEITNWQAYGVRLTNTDIGMTANRIDHNHIHDTLVIANAEAIQIGSGAGDSTHNLGTIVEFNLLSHVETDEDGELVSIKSSGNTLRGNTFRDSNKVVNGRHGSNNKFINNTLINLNTKVGLAAFGDNHQVIGNRFVGINLHVPSGDTTQTNIVAGGTGHPAARNQLVAGNIMEGVGYIHVGKSNYCCVPAQNTTLCANTKNKIITTGIGYRHTGTKILAACSTSIQIGTPVLMTPLTVGPNSSGALAL